MKTKQEILIRQLSDIRSKQWNSYTVSVPHRYVK